MDHFEEFHLWKFWTKNLDSFFQSQIKSGLYAGNIVWIHEFFGELLFDKETVSSFRFQQFHSNGKKCLRICQFLDARPFIQSGQKSRWLSLALDVFMALSSNIGIHAYLAAMSLALSKSSLGLSIISWMSTLDFVD